MEKIDANYIKTLLVDYLLDKKTIELIAIEVPYLYGSRRADLIAIINGKLVGFEIKSELDTLAKLIEQTNDYLDVFHEVYIVVANKFKKSPQLKKLPQNVGIMHISPEKKLNVQRKAKEKKCLKKEKVVYFLRKKDMITQINCKENLSISELRKKILNQLNISEVTKLAIASLEDRYLHKYKLFCSDRGSYTIIEDLKSITGVKKKLERF